MKFSGFVVSAIFAIVGFAACSHHHKRHPSSVETTLALPPAPHIAEDSCRKDPDDAFEPDAHMPVPRAKRDHTVPQMNGRGQLVGSKFIKGIDPKTLPCIVNTKARPIRVLSDDQIESYAAPWREELDIPEVSTKQNLVFANFYFDKQFWIADVDPTQIESMEFLLEYFPAIVPAAHSMLRFNMKPGHEMLLYPQRQSQVTGGMRKVRSFVSSVEATGPIGYKFDLVKGLFDEMAIVYRFVAIDDIASGKMMVENHKVDQIKLKIKPEDREKALRFAVSESNKYQLDGFYNTVARNCTTEPYRVLDHSINYPLLNDIEAFFTQHRKPLPTLAQRALKARGIHDGLGETLNEEFHFPDPTIKTK